MLFVKSDNLKIGMRLAKPIYNRNGVLLYERNTKLSLQGIESVKNFGLIGLYILEPAEPVPPMTEDDLEFERFQTMSVFSIKEDLNFMLRGRSPKNLNNLVNLIAKRYGREDDCINFMQNLRSSEDYVYKHAINMGILVALISNKANLSYIDQIDIITAALLHDMGKVNLPYDIKTKYGDYTDDDLEIVKKCQRDGIEMLSSDYNLSQGALRLINQMFNLEYSDDKTKSIIGGRILQIADLFDTMTAMKLNSEPMSELAAINYLLCREEYDQTVVSYLIASIDILYPGVCVELTNHENGLVVAENKKDVLRPVILGFNTNCIYDMSNPAVYKEVQIKDIMKTMDNRIKVDRDRLFEYIKK